jgi:hypothetical protein
MPISSPARPTTGKEVNTFTANYATGHKFYGYMDYFVNFPVQTFNPRNDGPPFTFSDDLERNIHNSTDNPPFHNHGRTLFTGSPLKTNELGQEIDIVTTMKYSKALSFECGLGAFVPNAIMRTTFNGSDIGLWGYFSTHVSF